MLSGSEIKKRLNKEIFISDFDESRLNPNSYNLRLHNELLVYDEEVLDMKKQNKTKRIIIPEEGYVLHPGILYLGRTVETTRTEGNIVPTLEGRSSTGRLGLQVHQSASLGDVNFNGAWTLEITCVHPIRIYPNSPICQICYHELIGSDEIKYNGKYQNSTDINASKMFKDFE